MAAIRILDYREGRPPSVELVSDFLKLSVEETYRICRRLKGNEIIDIVEGAFGTKLHILDHLKIEELPRASQGNRLDEELKKFQASQKDKSKKIEAFKAEHDKKKQDLFAELNRKLKEGLDKQS